ncbi:HPP family protein [Actinoplanes sp. N902-109]|uniref:CBS domain-containing protein n=1 Tax=Actinoplanes sp. (strain N902-109) TaxID=649831 RepID=UPI001E319104|nr:CBS domain-containing protein [Actinoplanes sp. N902-109]
MTRPVRTVHPAATVERAAHTMATHDVTALPVVDATGTLVGMVSECDVLQHQLPATPTAPSRPATVAEIMSPFPITARPATDIAVVADTMLEGDVRSMPVVDRGTVVGIVSRRDVLRTLL